MRLSLNMRILGNTVVDALGLDDQVLEAEFFQPLAHLAFCLCLGVRRTEYGARHGGMTYEAFVVHGFYVNKDVLSILVRMIEREKCVLNLLLIRSITAP